MSKFPVLWFFFVCASATAFADQVSLKNGDRLSGTIVKSDGKTLLLHTDYAGDVSLSWDAVQAVESKQALHIQLRDGKSLAGPVTTADGQLAVTTASGPVEAPLAQVAGVRGESEETAYQKSLHPGIFQDWKSGINVGFALTRGNSETKNLALAFTADRKTLHDKLSLYTNSIYATNDAPGATPHRGSGARGGTHRKPESAPAPDGRPLRG